MPLNMLILLALAFFLWCPRRGAAGLELLHLALELLERGILRGQA